MFGYAGTNDSTIEENESTGNIGQMYTLIYKYD